MSESNDSPDWSLLPHAPADFFGLHGQYDRKDLKRSYNRLLRQFKPEKFPAEFQRIRAAYEHLDNQLRYGMDLSRGSSAITYQWQTDETKAEETTSSSSAGRSRSSTPQADNAGQRARAAEAPRKIPLHERVQREPLPEVYRELSEKADKSAYEFYALAVMSDVLDRKDGLQFARWILQGLVRHRGDLGLVSLLYEYYRGPIPAAALPNLLIATAKAVPNDRFFSLTEPLWKQLLRERPFQDFQTTLRNCNAHIRDIGIDGQLAFSIEILKSAIWKGDLAWIEATMDFVEQQFERIPPRLEYEVELLALLRKYAAQRSQFLMGHPLRQMINRAVCDYFTQDQVAGDHSVLACQIHIAQDPAGLLDAFPFQNGEEYEHLYLVWISIAQDVFDRNLESRDHERDDSLWQSRAQALLQRIEQVTWSSAPGRVWKLAAWGYRGALGLICVAQILLLCILTTFIPSSSSKLTLTLVLAFLGFVVPLDYWLYARFFRPAWHRFGYKKELECHQKVWRAEFIELLDRSHLDYFELRGLLYECDATGLTTANRAVGFYQQDYALPMFSTAQRFVV